jgi:hypothetical protein
MRPLNRDWPKHLPPLGLFCWFIYAMSPTTGAIVIDDRVLEAETGLSYEEPYSRMGFLFSTTQFVLQRASAMASLISPDLFRNPF